MSPFQKLLLSSVFILLGVSAGAFAQSISVEQSDRNYAYSSTASEKPILGERNGQLLIGNRIQQAKAFSITPDLSYAAAMSTANNLSIFDYAGSLIAEASLKSFSSDDKTIALEFLNPSAVLVRSNVTQFEIINMRGESINTFNISSKAKQRPTEWASGPDGQSLVLYNPQVITNNGESTDAHILDASRRYQSTNVYYESGYNTADIYYQEDQQLFVATLNHISQEKSKVIIFDESGNVILNKSFDSKLTGASLSPGLSVLTIFTTGRMMAYNLESGERIGSSSVRGNPLVYAFYNPENSDLVGITGNQSNNLITDLGFQAVNVNARKIVRETVGGELNLSQKPSVTMFNREHRYEIFTPVNKMNIRISY